MNSQDYQDLFEDWLIPFLEKHDDFNFTFQQDNAPIHISKNTKNWFKAAQIPLLDWPV